MSGGLTFLHGHCTPRCIASVDKHFSYHTLQLITAGSVELFYDERRYEMHGCWLWPCHPGPRIRFHEWPRGQPWEHRYIAFTGREADEWVAQGLWLESPTEVVLGDDSRRITGWFDELLAAKLQPDRWSQWTAVNLLERILLAVAPLQSGEGHRPVWLTDALVELADFGGDEPDYQLLSERAGMGLSTFRRQFRRLTGSSVHNYRLDCRIALARRLLGDTNLPIKVISDRLGYHDVFYFSRQFRERSGVSPALYRKSRQAAKP